MARTPENATKARIADVLKRHDCWYFMPVQGGFGKPALDFLCARADDQRLFMIEAKALGQNPSDRQWVLIREARAKGIRVFIIDDQRAGCEPRWESCADLEAWLNSPYRNSQ